jgi:hypothetical protein
LLTGVQADLERLILSGEFFNPRSRSPSPTRSASPDWDRDYTHDEEYDASTAKNAQIEKMLGGPTDVAAEEGGIGVGVQGRTGVKGVIRDRAEAEARTKQKRSRDASDLAKRMERSALTGRTWKEDEAAAKLERALENGTQLSEDEDEDDDNGRKDVWGAPKGRFGHLREVGISGFVGAVEDERGTWVLVHLYDAVSPFLVVFVDLLTKAASLWNVAILLMIRYLSSLTSIPIPSFSELGQVFLGLLPRRRLPDLRPRLYGHHVTRGSRKKTKTILMGQTTMRTQAMTWMKTTWTPMSCQPFSRIGTANWCTHGFVSTGKPKRWATWKSCWFGSCSLHISLIISHLSFIQPSCHRASASFRSEGA